MPSEEPIDLELDRAEHLALRNLEYKKDRSARETLAYVRSRRELVERCAW